MVFTHDLDFGVLLNETREGGPSVVQVRTQDVAPEAIGSLVVTAVRDHEAGLQDGAIVTIQLHASRARVLPIRRHDGVGFPGGFSQRRGPFGDIEAQYTNPSSSAVTVSRKKQINREVANISHHLPFVASKVALNHPCGDERQFSWPRACHYLPKSILFISVGG